MIIAVRMLPVVSIVSALSTSPVHATTSSALQSVLTFCKANRTVDYPPDKGFGLPEDNGVPPEFVDMNVGKWRCMDGQVFICSDTADGDQCSRKSDNRHPRVVAEACQVNRDSSSVPSFAGHPYQYDWACRGGKPVLIKTYPLDRRGFFLEAWAPLIVKNGVISPTGAPDVLR